MVLEQSLVANVPADQLWSLLTNLATFKKDASSKSMLSLKGNEIKKGNTGTFVLNENEQLSVAVEDVEPGFSYVFSIKLLFAKLEIHRFIGYNNQKYHLVNRIKLTGLLGKFWWNKHFKKILLKSGLFF
jgi:hypothetical protein